MLHILFSAVLFCVILKWATLGLSAKLVAVAFYVVTVYVLTIFFFEKPESPLDGVIDKRGPFKPPGRPLCREKARKDQSAEYQV